jgi:site-specific DNA recombinase
MRAAIYARISHDPKGKSDNTTDRASRGGDGLGVARQEQDCRQLADTLSLTVGRVYVDNDTSAFSGKRRPDFEKMLDAMNNGEFDVLLCWHTDRLYRHMKDLERVIEIADTRGVQIRTVQGGELDLSNSAGRMVARILGSVARQESEHMSERRKRANIQRASNGMWQTANRPFGYTQQGVPLEPEASMVRCAVVDILAGKSIKQVAREWNAAGITGTRGNAFTAPNVRRLIVNPRYAGLLIHNGKEVTTGKWKPLIDADTHRGLVSYLSDPSRINCTAFEKKYVGSGVYRCGVCGGPLRHAESGGLQPGPGEIRVQNVERARGCQRCAGR